MLRIRVCRVKGLGFQDLAFRDYVSEFRIQGSGSRIQELV